MPPKNPGSSCTIRPTPTLPPPMFVSFSLYLHSKSICKASPPHVWISEVASSWSLCLPVYSMHTATGPCSDLVLFSMWKKPKVKDLRLLLKGLRMISLCISQPHIVSYLPAWRSSLLALMYLFVQGTSITLQWPLSSQGVVLTPFPHAPCFSWLSVLRFLILDSNPRGLGLQRNKAIPPWFFIKMVVQWPSL